MPGGPRVGEIEILDLKEPYKTVMTPYLTIQVALGRDTMANVSENAKLLVGAVLEKGFPDDIAQYGMKIADAQTIEAARVHFAGLSKILSDKLAADGLTGSGLMLVNCTMEQGGGVWLQAPGSVHNPYAGAKMLTCGDVIRKF